VYSSLPYCFLLRNIKASGWRKPEIPLPKREPDEPDPVNTGVGTGCDTTYCKFKLHIV